MSLPTKFFAIVTTLVVAACSFQPVYKQQSDSVSMSMASVAVNVVPKEPEDARFAQILTAELEDALNPTAKRADDRYTLAVTLTTIRRGQLVQNDREVTRYQMVAIADYAITDNMSDQTVITDSVKIVGSFDAVTSDYATYAAQEDTTKRLMRELASTVRLKVTHALNQ